MRWRGGNPLTVPCLSIPISCCCWCWPPTTDNWQKRWMNSEYKPDLGKFKLTAGKFYGDPVRDKGMWVSFHMNSLKTWGFAFIDMPSMAIKLSFSLQKEKNVSLHILLVSLQVYKLVKILNFMLSPHDLNHSVTKGRLWSSSIL